MSFVALWKMITAREEWTPKRLKFALARNDGGVWGEDSEEDGTVVLRSTEVALDGTWRIDDPARRRLTKREKEASLLLQGDLLVTKASGSEDHLGKTALVDQAVASLKPAFSNFMQRLRVRQGNDPRYYYYLLNSDVGREYLGCLGSTTTGLRNLSGGLLAELVVSGPPHEEQTQIAKFLDYETARIDALIEKQQQLIALLKEKRQAVISHAVTKGLNPNAPMRDSGVEWLGEVPAHWTVCGFSHAVSYQEGPGIMSSDFHDEGIPLVRISGVKGRWVTLEGCNFLDPELVARRWSHFRLRKGDLLISASASMGTVAEVREGTIGAIPYTGLIRLMPRKYQATKGFIRSLVVSNVFIQQIDLLKAGATIQHFGPTHLRQVRIARPPLHEQQAIASYIDSKTKEVRALTVKAEGVIELLQERRTALISAAVTGKIDVRSWQPPRSEFAAE